MYKMNSQVIKKKIAKLPDSSGVYFFIRRRGGFNHKKHILYIGKATSLSDRVRSYFTGNIAETRGPLISKMLAEFDDIKFQKTDSVLEALILEAYLIRKHQPPANTDLKDDKSFNYVVITEEDFPRVLVVRGKELETPSVSGAATQSLGVGKLDLGKILHTFGPFTNSGQLKEAMKIVRRLFPYRDTCPIPTRRVGMGRPCFNRQLGLCPGVCTGEISKKEYAKTIKNIVLFFEGNKKKLVKSLEREMKALAKNRQFEKAGKIKKQIFALGHIQDVALIKTSNPNISHGVNREMFRIESYDVAHMSGQNVVGVMTVVENGEIKKSDYRKFKIIQGLSLNKRGVGDTKALAEVLTRRLAHIEWPMPDLIVVDGGKAQKNVMEKVLKENGAQIMVMSVVKDEHHRPKEILGDPGSRAKLATGQAGGWNEIERQILIANSEAHRFAIGYHKKLRGKI